MSLDTSNRNEMLAEAIQSNLTVHVSPGLRDAVNFVESGTRPVHRWFRYREGFSPAILDKIDGYQRIFDPFCGCGTTLIEAKKTGVNAVGSEVNPLAVFVARVKTRQYSARDAEDLASWANPEVATFPSACNYLPLFLHPLKRIRVKNMPCLQFLLALLPL